MYCTFAKAELSRCREHLQVEMHSLVSPVGDVEDRTAAAAGWRSPPLGAALCDALCFPRAAAQLARLRRTGFVERRPSTTQRNALIREQTQSTPAREPLKVPAVQFLQVAQAKATAVAPTGDGQDNLQPKSKPEPSPDPESESEPELEPEPEMEMESEPESEPQLEPEVEDPRIPAPRPSGPPPGGPSPNTSAVQRSPARGLQALRTPPRAGEGSTAAPANAS